MINAASAKFIPRSAPFERRILERARCPQMIAGIAPKKRQKNHDKIANTKLQMASGSVRGAVATGVGCCGNGGGVSSAIAPF